MSDTSTKGAWRSRLKGALDQAKGHAETLKDKIEEKVDVDRVLSGAKNVLEVGSEAAEILVQLGDGLTIPGGVALSMRAVHTIRELRSKTPQEHFSKGWKPLDLHELDAAIYAAFASQPSVKLTPVPAMPDDEPAYESALEGVDFGWAVFQNHSRRRRDESFSVQGVWIRESQDESEALAVLGRCIWKHHASMRLLVTSSRRTQSIRLSPEPPREILPSRFALDLYNGKIKPRVDRGGKISVFLIGESRAGKSSALRYIASLHGGLQLRFKLSDLRSMSGSDILQIVQILRPDIILVDDFDRLVGGKEYGYGESDDNGLGADMLDPIECINEIVSILMVTANYSEGITDALLQPGRFDIIETLDAMDPELIAKLLAGAPAHLIKAVQRVKLPIGHVEELAKRAKDYGGDWVKAEKELQDLAQRSKRILELNERKIRRRTRRPLRKGSSRSPSLVYKTPAQKARTLESAAKANDKFADTLIRRAERAKKKAEDQREKAEEWKNKPTPKKSAKKKKKPAAAKRRPSAKTPGKNTKKPVSPSRQRKLDRLNLNPDHDVFRDKGED